MERKNFNEVLKAQEQQEGLQKQNEKQSDYIAIDDARRIKVLSPGRLVFNRFIRNKLAIVGAVILAVMFLFAFLGAVLYPYGQTEIFYKYDNIVVDYAMASVRTEYSALPVDESVPVPPAVKTRLNSYILEMEQSGQAEKQISDEEGNSYVLRKKADLIYSLSTADRTEVAYAQGEHDFAVYNSIVKSVQLLGGQEEGFDTEGFTQAIATAVGSGSETFSFGGQSYRLTAGKKKQYTVTSLGNTGLQYTGAAFGEDFAQAVAANQETGSFEWNGKKYSIVATSDTDYRVYEIGSNETQLMLATTLVFDAADGFTANTDSFKAAALAAYAGDKSFEAGGEAYTIEQTGDEILVYGAGADKPLVGVFSDMAVRATDGSDSLPLGFKEAAREAIDAMDQEGALTYSFTYEIPNLNKVQEGQAPSEGPTPVKIQNKNGSYSMSCEQLTYLIDIYASPSLAHPFGTDGNGMDVLARMMYGGRVSLMVCFVVVIIQTALGVIFGGIAGFFGGWIDNLIMRIVDIFYCIPSMPILIIMGAFFDSLKMEAYTRLVWMMVILGVLGWASVARLVRGQILSLREQEFMVAAESIGLRTSRRIFKHLVPNVMPQLIVTASNALGGIIITESTLSFLGLGVKHPLATWGTMINMVTSSAESMIKYTYIWIPVGLLICLTVVAFNFVGDGLRDAFDPKMKR